MLVGTHQVLQAALAVPDYVATVVVNPEPDGLDAEWHLEGPDSYELDGSGDRTLTVWTAGSYTITWQPVTGWSLRRGSSRCNSGSWSSCWATSASR